MLREIAIKNFAIIDDLRIVFSDGLTILSGETGAGKSIIISALNILLGSRADAGMIRSGEQTAELEALFDLDPASPAVEILKEQGYEETDELLIRRVLSANNRHRVYVNGRLATMQALNAIAGNLAGISGQHEHQRLLLESEHLKILDQFGNLAEVKAQVRNGYDGILPMIKKLAELNARKADRAERIELLSYQREEIAAAEVQPGEDEQLSRELQRLKHAEVLFEGVGQSVEALYDREGAVADELNGVRKAIEKAASIDPELEAVSNLLADLSFRLEDAAEQLRSYRDTIEFDPARIDAVESRLDLLNRLKRKYGGTLDAVCGHLSDIEAQLEETENLDSRIAATESALDAAHQALVRHTDALSRKRQEAAERLSEKVEAELRSLNMPDTRFAVTFRRIEARSETPRHLCRDGYAITPEGAEQAAFMIAPNVGEDLKPLSKIASGGELSRVILAIKAILVNTDPVETVVFDEVDAGIGGQTADVVGQKLAGLAAHSQVICITHLAQIARFGNQHFKIEKQVTGGRTTTRILPLDDVGRVEETARMIGGRSITETTRAHAEELIRTAARPKQCN